MPRTLVVTIVVACALFMENMDSTIIATSLPAIGIDLKQDPVDLKLAFTAYLLSLAIFIPISGWCADRFGARVVFRAAIIVFTIGSICCGLSSSLGEFVAARALQGMGGAMMSPIGRLVLLRSVPKSELLRAFAMLSIPALIGPILGPPVGGFITTYAHWRWIFWINVPIGIIGVILVTLFIPNIKEEAVRPLDKLGFFLSGIGLSTLIFGTTIIGKGLLPPLVVWGLVGLGAALIVLYLLHARRAPHPIIDLSLLRIATFRTNIFGGFLFRLGTGSVPFLLPLMLQIGFGLSAFQSGLLTFCSALGALVMKTTAPPILRRFGFRTILTYNALLSAALLACFGLFTAATSHVVIIAVLLCAGFFRSLQFTSLVSIAYADVEKERMSRATSFVAVSQQLSIASGVAISAFVLEVMREIRGTSELVASDFSMAFAIIALIAAASSLVHRRLPADAGAELTGRRS
ncbi:MAG: DHA2 family efflux MFS transporter permease subunit [Hyphomicrobiaceae bacterium]|nr:DHA2 family efflux MFS transporter permease subunit [Hyphomicrobiaceae bacterium]